MLLIYVVSFLVALVFTQYLALQFPSVMPLPSAILTQISVYIQRICYSVASWWAWCSQFFHHLHLELLWQAVCDIAQSLWHLCVAPLLGWLQGYWDAARQYPVMTHVGSLVLLSLVTICVVYYFHLGPIVWQILTDKSHEQARGLSCATGVLVFSIACVYYQDPHQFLSFLTTPWTWLNSGQPQP